MVAAAREAIGTVYVIPAAGETTSSGPKRRSWRDVETKRCTGGLVTCQRLIVWVGLDLDLPVTRM